MKKGGFQKIVLWSLVAAAGGVMILWLGLDHRIHGPIEKWIFRPPEIETDYFAPPIDAAVLAVKNDDRLVVLDVGDDQKVKAGYEFTVYREDHFIGKVKVIKVFKDMSAARILFLQENEEIKIGDKAATQI